jgi:ubiquinone/menaquinone biosynthesis C-methylase UbiE
MVEPLAPEPGETILELASGTGEIGFVAAAMLGDEGKLISTDFAPNMVKVAREESQRLGLRNVEHRELDARTWTWRTTASTLSSAAGATC